jgi:hypothetical protein
LLQDRPGIARAGIPRASSNGSGIMKPTRAFSSISRRVLLTTAATLSVLLGPALPFLKQALAQTDPLPSWSDGASKRAISEFVARVTQQGGADFVPPAERIATFDNDGTLWVEHPMYTQMAFILDRVKVMAPLHPEWNRTQPFKAVLEGDTADQEARPAIYALRQQVRK